MDDVRDDDRWMALAGPVFLLLLLVAVLLTGGTPGEGASGKDVIQHYSDSKGRNAASVFIFGPAAAALLVFAARLAGELKGTGAARRLMQYGAVLYAAALTLGAVFLLTAVTAADHKQAAVAETANALNNNGWIPIVIGIAAMLVGAGLGVLRSGVLPRWLGWVGVIVGVLSLLGPGGFLGFLVAPFWIAIAGVLLYQRRTVALPA